MQEASACYEGNLDCFSFEKFVEILVVDSCFLHEIFVGFECKQGFEQHGYPDNKHIFSNNEYMQFGNMRDMILLENQIRFFVLEKLYRRNYSSGKSIVDFLINLWCNSMVSSRPTFIGSKFLDHIIKRDHMPVL